MKISSLSIKNFKSIHELIIDDIENALILVGKNNTGKTAILDAILAVAGNYQVQKEDFNRNGNVEIKVTIEITEEDLKLLNMNGLVSKYKRFDIWLNDFKNKLPAYKNGALPFCFIVNLDGKTRYSDGYKKNNNYIKQLFPKLHFIDHRRELQFIEEDIFMAQGQEGLSGLREKKCMFDKSKVCNNCFQCIGIIERKTPKELTVFETTKLLEYKLFHLNLDSFINRINYYYHKNNGFMQDIHYIMELNREEVFRIRTLLADKERGRESHLDTMSEGIKSIYILSLLEAYIEESSPIPCIIIIEDPEIYLHPQLQKVAGEILYRLSKKNQVIFSTHSPNMIYNFTSRQIRQVIVNSDNETIINEKANIAEILDNLGYTASDLMNVSFVFIVEGKQDRNRLPLLLERYYSEVYDRSGKLQRISIITTNSCTNIKTYANLKYINQLYIKDQFLMIRDGDGKDQIELKGQLCSYYQQRAQEDLGNLPRVSPKNVLILKYYSFENYFLDPDIMTKIGVVKSVDEFYDILFHRYQQYLYKLASFQHIKEQTGVMIKTKADIVSIMEAIRIYGRGHNLFDIFYGRYKGDRENEILKLYIEQAPREIFGDILTAIDEFIYFECRKK